MTIRRAREYKTSKTRPIFWVRTFSLVKRNTIESTNFPSNKLSNEKVTVNPKHSHDYQLTCQILIKFTSLMVSKLLYLLINCKHLIACVRTGQRCDQNPSNPYGTISGGKNTFGKNS